MNRALENASRLSVCRRMLTSLALPALLLLGASAASAAPSVVEKTVTVFGAKIYYQEAGSGPTVILLHGLGGDSTNWAQTIGPLSEKYRVIVPDQIGFGRSEKPFIAYRVGTFVDFLAGLYKELKIERASLVGNSLGGWIATAFAIAYPERVDKLVLVGAAGFSLPQNDPSSSVVNSLNTSTRDAIKQILPLVFYNRQLFANEAAIDQFFTRRVTAGDGYTIARVLESVIRGEDVLDNKLSAVKNPTLLVWGREDGLTPLSFGERFKKEIAGSQLVVFDKCGHVPQLEKPAEFNAALLKFLAGGA